MILGPQRVSSLDGWGEKMTGENLDIIELGVATAASLVHLPCRVASTP